MTEAEWLACSDPEPMLAFIKSKVGHRDVRLFFCALCRRFWHLLTDFRQRDAVKAAELYAGGIIGEDVLRVSWEAAQAVKLGFYSQRPNVNEYGWQQGDSFLLFAHAAAQAASPGLTNCEPADLFSFHGWYWCIGYDPPPSELLTALNVAQLDAVRDIVSNPFRPVTLRPNSLTSTVLALAQVIYTDRAFDRLPILADALLDTGWDNQDILDHCHDKVPHVRGCWVIDFLLGKS